MAEQEDNISEQPILKCPHCNEFIIISKINCGIFRHGTLKSNLKQIDPHSLKELCEYFITNDLIYGCGKPFKIVLKDNTFETEICDYI
jgi:hypothetical protein